MIASCLNGDTICAYEALISLISMIGALLMLYIVLWIRKKELVMQNKVNA